MINQKIDYFITLCECLSFTQTAARHNVSQTAISQYIASLEDRLEVRLFNRKPHSVSMTEAGKYYYQQVTSILRTYEETRSQLKTIAAHYHGYIKVGIGVYEYCSTEHLFSSFLTLHPEIKVDILQYPYSELSEKLRTEELDLIIGLEHCESDFAKRELQTRTLFESRNYLVADPKTAAKYPNGCVKEILENECLITNCEDYGPSSLQMLHNLLTEEIGFVPHQIEQTNSVNTQLMMVRARHGVAIVPGFVVDAQGGDLVRFSFESKNVCYKLMKLARKKNDAADLFFNFDI